MSFGNLYNYWAINKEIKYIIILYMLSKLNKLIHPAIFLIILFVIGFLYKRYEEKIDKENMEINNNFIQQYLLGDEDTLQENKKPILWIPINYEYNARKWSSFGSRSSFELNQPYIYLTMISIINNCSGSFKICIVDDNSFDILLPGWNVNMSYISDPVLDYMRSLALVKLLYKYGGMVIPPSFVCNKNLISLYDYYCQNNKIFVGENIDRGSTSVNYEYYPDINIIGGHRENNTFRDLIEFMEQTISSDYTAETNFLGSFNIWCKKGEVDGKINVINGKLLGIKDENNDAVTIEKLLGNDYIQFNPNFYGICIPEDEILKRVHYQWFARLSQKQVLEGNTIISKYLLLSVVPIGEKGVLEGFEENPDWIRYWSVPSRAPVWGLKPNYLGNNLNSSNNPINYK